MKRFPRARGKQRGEPATEPADTVLPDEYPHLLTKLKERIERALVQASLSVNRERLLLYWDLGRAILGRQREQGWGAKVISRLSADLIATFPGTEGFSPRSLKYMRAFAEAYPDPAIVQQLLHNCPWGHHMVLLDRLASPLDLLFYHTKIHSYVVIEIKVGDFTAAHAGQLALYVEAVDRQLRTPALDGPTIGIILCRTKDDVVVEYTLSGISKPVGVGTYHHRTGLPEAVATQLPDPKRLQREFELAEEQLRTPRASRSR